MDAGHIVLERFDGYWGKKPQVEKLFMYGGLNRPCEQRWY